MDGPLTGADGRELGKRDLSLPAGYRHQDPAQRAQVGPEIAHVADIHRVALAALDRGGHIFAADGLGHRILGLVHAQPVAGQFVPVPLEVEKIAARRALRKDAARALDRRQHRFDLRPDLLDGRRGRLRRF